MQTCPAVVRLVFLLTLLSLLPRGSALSQERYVDFRYAPFGGFAAICFPDDWQKSVVTDQGSLGYDFGPGPYARPLTRISVGPKDDSVTVLRQYYEDPRIPVATTEYRTGTGTMVQRAFAIVPDRRQAHQVRHGRVIRLGGLTGTVGWASPPAGYDSAFRNVAWGVNRAVRYRISVKRGSRKHVALGLCEPYKPRAGMRIMDLHVEGAAVQTVDPRSGVGKNRPLVYLFKAGDLDGDGLLEIEVHASQTSPDPNVYLNVFWVFEEDAPLTVDAVASGELSGEAELYYDCGPEMETLAEDSRLDGLIATFNGKSVTPVVRVLSKRKLRLEPGWGLSWDGRPYLQTRPAPVDVRYEDGETLLELPTGTEKVEVIVAHGKALAESFERVENLEEEIDRSRWFWQHASRVPRNTITVPDTGIQYLLEASIRNLYQVHEYVDGVPQFQPGPSVYRGLWVHDALRHLDAALTLRDTAVARLNIETVLSFQQPNGRVRVMAPYTMYRETPLAVYQACFFARSTNDKAWLRTQWSKIQLGIDWIREQRIQTLSHPDAPNAGLLPAGFSDGGLSGVQPEYGSVYWSMISLREAARAARWLGETDDAASWETLFEVFLASFQKAAARDVRRDAYGNLFLPVMVADTSRSRPPQQAQWGICQAVYIGRWFDRNDSLVIGTLAMLESEKSEGLPLNTGWLHGGVWGFFVGSPGPAHLWQENYREAQDLLYAYANHASQLGTWVEEQMPRDVGKRTTGDGSNASASAIYIAYVRRFIAMERDSSLDLLAGVPDEWYRPGGRIALDSVLTEFGPVTLDLSFSAGGESGALSLEPIPGNGQTTGGPVLFLSGLKERGYTREDGQPLPVIIRGAWGEGLNLIFKR
ncbi:MAG: hypothetical protein WBG01_01840 [Bacteroidota bacterium]